MAKLVEVNRSADLPDILIGTRLRICDDESGQNFSDGVVRSVDVVGSPGCRKELMTLVVERRVINGEPLASFDRELRVDCEIPMHLVKSLGFERAPGSAERGRRVAVMV